MAPQMPGMSERIRKERDAIRATYPASHSRTSEIAAHFELGWRLWLEFAVACGATTERESVVILARVRAALLAGCRDQVEEQSKADPIELYRLGLQAAISSGRAYVEGTDGGPPPAAGSWGYVSRPIGTDGDSCWEPANRQARVGWLDDNNLYLLPKPAFQAANAQVDGGLGIGQADLDKRLRDDHMLISTGEDGHIAIHAPRALVPSRPRVLHLALLFLVAVATPGPTAGPTCQSQTGEVGTSQGGGTEPVLISNAALVEAAGPAGPADFAHREGDTHAPSGRVPDTRPEPGSGWNP